MPFLTEESVTWVVDPTSLREKLLNLEPLDHALFFQLPAP